MVNINTDICQLWFIKTVVHNNYCFSKSGLKSLSRSLFSKTDGSVFPLDKCFISIKTRYDVGT